MNVQVTLLQLALLEKFLTRGIVGLDSIKMSMNGVEVVRYAKHMDASNWFLDL